MSTSTRPWSVIRTQSSRDAALKRIGEIKEMKLCFASPSTIKQLNAEKRRLWKKVRKAERYLSSYENKVS